MPVAGSAGSVHYARLRRSGRDMGNAASCHAACTSEQAVEVAPALYPFALPARASAQLHELVEAVRYCTALNDLEQVR